MADLDFLPQETSSAKSLPQLWADIRSNSDLTSDVGPSAFYSTMHCAHFNSYCAFYPHSDEHHLDPPRSSIMTSKALLAKFEANYVPPKFWPSFIDYAKRTNAFFSLRSIKELSIGGNVEPPHVGIIYGAYITALGTVFSPMICIPCWPEEPAETWPTFIEYLFKNQVILRTLTYFDLICSLRNKNLQVTDWLEVKEVLVITHSHHSRGWHWLIGEAYRMLVMLPYLQAHPDIFIHISDAPMWAEQYEYLFDIPR